MKKALSVFLTLAVLLSLTYQTVFAAEGTLELLETRNDAGGNVIFVFRFTGDFKKNDFKGGKVFFGDESFPMGCNIVDKEEGIVQCTTSRATAGQYVNINLAGFVFNTFVPLRTGGGGGGSSTACYNIYDLFFGNQDLFWAAFDVLCSDNPPSELVNHPDPFGGTWNYYFDSHSPCNDPIVEDAYYASCGD